MKKIRIHSLVLLISSAFLLAACADLRIRKLSLSPTCPTTKTEITFSAEVENIGTGSSGPNTVAFRVGGESVPKYYNIPALASGKTYTVQRKLLLDVAQDYQNTVIVDVRNNVSESREDNNEAKQFFTVTPVPDTAGLTNFEYSEGLATILRGVLIDETAAQNLDIKPGYYHIREFRVQNQPSEKVKVLNLEKNYAEIFGGQSTFPMRNEAWVFSIVENDEQSPNRMAFTGRDYYGHTFKYEISLDSKSNCWKVVSATIDCAKVALSTQTYVSSVLNTCGWTSEPAWTR